MSADPGKFGFSLSMIIQCYAKGVAALVGGQAEMSLVVEAPNGR